MLTVQELRAALTRAPLDVCDELVCRAVLADDPYPPLSGEGSLHHDGRYHRAGDGRIAYLAGSLRTVLFERGLYYLDEHGDANNADFPPTTVLSVRARIDRVLDLRLLVVQDMLSTNIVELTRPWVGAEAATDTQRLGRAAYDDGQLHGLVAPSALDPEGWNLVVFIDRLGVGEALRIVER